MHLKRDEVCGAQLQLDANYKTCQKDSRSNILTDDNIFCIAIFGDGAKSGKILLSTSLQVVLDVIDCSDHISEDGKNAEFYICIKILKIMVQRYWQGPRTT